MNSVLNSTSFAAYSVGRIPATWKVPVAIHSGDVDGATVGNTEGAGVGQVEGPAVGDAEGDTVGVAVGLEVARQV
jgi:hypothetical protein